MPKSFRPMFKFAKEPDAGNGQRFATEKEAWDSAAARFSVWTYPVGFCAEPSDDEVNYKWENGRDVPINPDGSPR